MWLLIDDMKNLAGYEIICKKADPGLMVLKQLYPHIGCLGIDFDLGESKSGSDVLKVAINEGYLPDKVIIVSMNPPGIKDMKAILHAHGYKSNDGTTWMKRD